MRKILLMSGLSKGGGAERVLSILANDFSDNENLEKNGLSTPSSASSIMLFSKEKKGDKYLMTYVVTYTVDTNTFTNKMSFEIKKSDKAKFGYLVTSDKITLSDYTK